LNNFKNLRGTVDLLPEELIKWQNVEEVIRQTLLRSSVKEIRTPIIEKTELFIRVIGEGTDVVNKEMYTFLDKGERSCTLRPEGTASVARAIVNNRVSNSPLEKLWYMGPMFRYERPQAGRQRQFHQLGVEYIGYESFRSDVEIIVLAWDLLQRLGITELTLEINTLGNSIDRKNFEESFLDWLEINSSNLDSDSQKRIDKNPLRILDSKNKETQNLLEDAPKLIDFLSDESLNRYLLIKKELDFLKIPFKENFKLVRGLDYYNHTAFEITSGALGAQATVCGGGRYDNLINQISGLKIPAIGFAIGMERLMLLAGQDLGRGRDTDIYIVNKGEIAQSIAMALFRKLKNFDLITELDLTESSFSKQFKKANKNRARGIIVIGDEEAIKKQFKIRLFSENGIKNNEEIISLDDDQKLKTWLNKNLF
tara:strand:- start:1525 stop:2799 length:1275 start_codon:yes stop_codon:yes gene_type:complete